MTDSVAAAGELQAIMMRGSGFRRTCQGLISDVLAAVCSFEAPFAWERSPKRLLAEPFWLGTLAKKAPYGALLAGTSGNRTQPGQVHCPATALKAAASTRSASIPVGWKVANSRRARTCWAGPCAVTEAATFRPPSRHPWATCIRPSMRIGPDGIPHRRELDRADCVRGSSLRDGSADRRFVSGRSRTAAAARLFFLRNPRILSQEAGGLGTFPFLNSVQARGHGPSMFFVRPSRPSLSFPRMTRQDADPHRFRSGRNRRSEAHVTQHWRPG